MLLARGFVSLANVLPVDNLPDGLEVIRASILVLQVVRVLPNVNSEERNEPGGTDRILV